MSIITSIVSVVVGPLLRSVESIVHDLATQKISETEAKTKLAEIEATVVAHAQTEASTIYQSHMEAVAQNEVLQRLTAAVVITQLAVLLFYQIGTPLLLYVDPTWTFPKPAVELEWAYALVAGGIGVYAVLRKF